MYLEATPNIDFSQIAGAIGTGGAVKYRQKIKLAQKYANKCFYCNHDVMASEATRDHFFPKCQGHALNGNQVVACAKCNHRKGDAIVCRDLVVRFIKWWSLFPYKTSAIGELYHEFHQAQALISFIEFFCGAPNIPGEIRAEFKEECVMWN